MENKIGKYFKYAIGEILLVIIGILIALQINNLNDQFKEKKTLISDLKNAQAYIQGEIEKEQNEVKSLTAFSDTVQNALRIIEEVNYPSPTDVKYLINSRRLIGIVGLRTDNSATLQNLSVNLTKSKRESRHQLIGDINEQIEFIQQLNRLQISCGDNILRLLGSGNKAIWRKNSKGEFFYDFALLKNDYDIQYIYQQSITYKGISVGWGLRIIEKYELIEKQIGELLKELD